MKRALLLAFVALALQVGAGLLFGWISEAAYQTPRRLDEAMELPLTWTGLVFAGPVALSCATLATQHLLQRVRLAHAVPAVLLLCVPPMLVGTLVTFALACVAGWC